MYPVKFSIIVTTFNRPADLDACLRSIAAQHDEHEAETIVVDDGGTSDLSQLVPRIDIYVRNPSNLGPSYSRNIAALRSRGDVLVFLDDDTELRPDSLAELAKIMDDHSDIGAVGGCGPADETGEDVEFISAKTCGEFKHEKFMYFPPSRDETRLRVVGPNKRSKYFCYPSIGDGRDALYDCDHVESAFLAIPRRIFDEAGGYDPHWFYMCEDRDLCLEIKSRGYRVVAAWAPRANSSKDKT